MTDDRKKSDEMKANLDDLSARVSAAREANEPKSLAGLEKQLLTALPQGWLRNWSPEYWWVCFLAGI